MARYAKWFFVALILIVLAEIPIGYEMGSGALHPARRELTASLATEARDAFTRANATSQDFTVQAADGTQLRGWAVVPNPLALDDHAPRDWVMLFHGQGDNRAGMTGFAEFLIRAGYGVLMMDSRAQGESGGAAATYGAEESEDERTEVNQLERDFRVRHLFALGVSMGGAIALDAAGGDSRIDAVVAECPFANLQEASEDYVTGHHGPWLGRTILWPATRAGIYATEHEGRFDAAEFAPMRTVARRTFAIFLIVDGDDRTLPLRHAEQIYQHAAGAKEMWIVPHAEHASGMGSAPEEYRRRVLAFLGSAEGKSAAR